MKTLDLVLSVVVIATLGILATLGNRFHGTVRQDAADDSAIITAQMSYESRLMGA